MSHTRYNRAFAVPKIVEALASYPDGTQDFTLEEFADQVGHRDEITPAFIGRVFNKLGIWCKMRRRKGNVRRIEMNDDIRRTLRGEVNGYVRGTLTY